MPSDTSDNQLVIDGDITYSYHYVTIYLYL